MAQVTQFEVTKNLEQWLKDMAKDYPDCLPPPLGAEYASQYSLLANYLNEHVHTEVERGALLAQIEHGAVSYETACYLNNHGPGHVNTVIEKATDLLRELKIRLSLYEGYLLLAAIQFHDAGNFYGRDQHEKKLAGIMNSPDVAGRLGDATERRVIANIASVHGGLTADGHKDTISQLLPTDDRFGQEIRPRFLAATLRFADELADDRTRASGFRRREGTLPPGSQLFHAYSHALQSVRVTGPEISLSYEIDSETGARTFPTPNGRAETYLIDEIYARTKKMHQERIYCMRFWPPGASCVARIRVRIEVLRGASENVFLESKTITFTREQEGYPGKGPDGVCDLCLPRDLDLPDGTKVREFLEGGPQEGDA